MDKLRRAKAKVERTNGEQKRAWASKPPPISVRLPDIPSVPELWRSSRYVIRSLLGSGDSNPKLRKSNLAGKGFKTWGLGLAPARESGFQLCSSSSAGCRDACLFHQGHARIDPAIASCRIAKSVAWKAHREWFEARLIHELERVEKRAREKGFRVAVRLNVTSDIMWERELPDLFERFATVTFYDYSKHFKRMRRFLAGDFPANYHLTFSQSEDNSLECHEVLSAGGNVAVVFRSRPFPERHLGFAVFDGDETDLRFLDPPNAVVALKAKGSARDEESGFVVDIGQSRWPLV